ncbi:MAG: DNA primase [Bacteroidota bacterium]
MIPKETIDRITETARVEEVVGDYVSLKKRGTNLIGNCPFHNEKTPSFYVSPVKGIYKCFGCGKAGNSVNFLMEHDKLTYPDALRQLAKKYGIELNEEIASDKQIEEQNLRESLFLANSFAQKYYTNHLLETEHGKSIGYSYFVERGFSDEIIKKFQLGFSSDVWDGFAKDALKEGYNKEILIKAGLITEKDNRLFDRFRSRVLFPVHTLSGRVIAFSARTLSSDKTIAKYVNSPETEIYQKRNVLYGLYFAKKAIITNDNCFLVEGNTDVISMFQAGIENVVASSGTSLTSDQIRLIQRYTNNITILYDGDSAGIKASFRGIDLILEEGMNVRVVLFPDGDDPDSYARKNSASVIAEFIKNNAKDFITFKTNILKADAEGDPIKMSVLIKDIVATIALIPDAIIRNLYTQQCSQLLNISEQILHSEIGKIRTKKSKSGKDNQEEQHEVTSEEIDFVAETPKEKTNTTYYQEMDVIRIMLNHGQKILKLEILNENAEKTILEIPVAQAIVLDLCKGDYFSDPIFKQIFKEYFEGVQRDEILPDQVFIQHKEAEITKIAIDLIHSQYSLSPEWETEHNIQPTDESSTEMRLKSSVEEAVLKLKAKKIQELLNHELEELKKASNDEDALVIMNNYNNLQKQKIEIDKKFGRVIS